MSSVVKRYPLACDASLSLYLFHPSHSFQTYGWRTLLIVPELTHEVTIWKQNEAIYHRLLNLEWMRAEMYRGLEADAEIPPVRTKSFFFFFFSSSPLLTTCRTRLYYDTRSRLLVRSGTQCSTSIMDLSSAQAPSRVSSPCKCSAMPTSTPVRFYPPFQLLPPP